MIGTFPKVMRTKSCRIQNVFFLSRILSQTFTNRVHKVPPRYLGHCTGTEALQGEGATNRHVRRDIQIHRLVEKPHPRHPLRVLCTTPNSEGSDETASVAVELEISCHLSIHLRGAREEW